MRIMRWSLVLALVLSALVVGGCGSKGGKGGELEGIFWVLRSYQARNALQEVPANMSVDALFENGRVIGSSGVNTYVATYDLSGSSLTTGDALSTMMAGPPLAMQVEQDYLAALEKSSTYTATAASLIIYDGDGAEVLVYDRGEVISLTGVTWEATLYNNGTGAVVGILSGTSITAAFGKDGSLSGTSGVNNYTATYTAESSAMTIGMGMTTLMAGTPEAMEQEAAYLAALPTTASYLIQGDKLELRRADGALVASYRAVK